MKKVYVTEPIHEKAQAYLAEHFEVIQGASTKKEEILQKAEGCDAMLIRSAKVSADLMEALPGLRVIAKHGVGVDNIDLKAASERGILVVNAPFSNLNAVAEHTVALMMALPKHLAAMDRLTRQGGFSRRGEFVNEELAGKTVGFVGLGKIARKIARKLSGMGMNILASDPYVSAGIAAACGVRLCSREEMFRESDFVSLHTPLLPETEKMANREFFRAMKQGSYFINVSRGPVVDEEALVEALQSGWLAGAALDVYDPEPPRPDNPLFAMDQVILTPHNAALTDQALLAMAMDSAKGICDVLEGRRPEFLVNPAVWEKRER